METAGEGSPGQKTVPQEKGATGLSKDVYHNVMACHSPNDSEHVRCMDGGMVMLYYLLHLFLMYY